MEPNLNTRSEKILGMIGIRLKKKGVCSEWKVETVLPQSTSKAGFIPSFEESDFGTENKNKDGNSLSSIAVHAKEEINFKNQSYSKILSEQVVRERERQDISDIVSNEKTAIENAVHTDENLEFNVSDGDSSSEEDPFSSDDSMKDPNYRSDESSSTSTSDNATSSQRLRPLRDMDQNEADDTIKKKVTRKRKAVPSEWKRNQTKYLRNSGKAYKMLNKGQEVSERKMKPPCSEKCSQKCTEKFSQEEREKLFQQYWEMGNILKQRTFILTLMQEINAQSDSRSKRRAMNNAFYFEKEGKKIRVCKLFFTSTLGITNRCIRSVISKRQEGDLEDRRGKHKNRKVVPEEIKNEVREHIKSIPKIESHYTRAHTEKEYIEGGKTIVELYRDYKRDCLRENKPFATLDTYRKCFNYEFNLAFFVPKKDQCQKCVSYENSNEEERSDLKEEYEQHQKEKRLSREEKEKDKNKVNKSYVVACFDLQATLPTPRGDVSTFYYRSKLSTYNFTVCELTQKGQGSVECFMWHEGEGKRGAVEIGSCLLKYLQEKSEAVDNGLDIVFYSDNCGGQQKNKYVLAAYFFAVANYNIRSITHKYLVTGHTQNEGDNVHSVIEKNIKRSLKSGPIYTPSQYVMLVQTAKKSGEPYKVVEMSHDDFLDVKKLSEQTTLNFTKNTNGDTFKFNDVSVFRIEKDHLDHFSYKTSYSEDQYKTVNIREKERRSKTILLPFKQVQLDKAYNDSLPIAKKKHDDLMYLLRSNCIKKSHSYFYNSLKVSSCENASS